MYSSSLSPLATVGNTPPSQKAQYLETCFPAQTFACLAEVIENILEMT